MTQLVEIPKQSLSFFNHLKKARMVWWTWSRLGFVVLGPWLNLAESSAVKWRRESPLLRWEELIKVIKVRFSTQCLALVSQSMFTSSPTSPPFRNPDINYYHQRDWTESMYCGCVEAVSIKLSVFVCSAFRMTCPSGRAVLIPVSDLQLVFSGLSFLNKRPRTGATMIFRCPFLSCDFVQLPCLPS